MLGSACSLGPEEATARLDGALARVTQAGIHGAVMRVDAPRHGITRDFAHGTADTARGTAMSANTPFYSASVGKLFVATAVLKLVADGRLSLEDPITRFVPTGELAGLPVEGGDAALGRITVAMLLSHRSGLPDYFSDASRDGAPRLFDRIVTERERSWSRRELLDDARAHHAPAGAPGLQFHYADTNYDLLGMVLERITGQPFHRAVRELVLAPLSLHHTWYHAFEPPPEGTSPPADVWVSGVNLRGAPALSVDQAGGGLITTVSDLSTFIRALVSGRPVPLSALETDFTADAMHPGIDVGRCAWRIRPRGVFFALAGLPTLVGHSGSTGVWAYYAAEWDAVFAGAVSDSAWQEKHIEFLLRDVVPVVARTKSARPPGAH
jgi:CubicO group peptidase (beta-lactamase class C family)